MSDRFLIGKVLFYRGFFFPDLISHQFETALDQLVEVNVCLLKRLAPRELRHIHHQFVQVHDSSFHQLDRIQAIPIANAVAQHRDTKSYAAERIPDFMRYLGRSLAHSRE